MNLSVSCHANGRVFSHGRPSKHQRCNALHTTNYNTLQRIATHYRQSSKHMHRGPCLDARPQHTATRCNTLQHTATHCNTLQHTVTHCNTLQHTATHCNTLQHTATHYRQPSKHMHRRQRLDEWRCNALQHAARHYNTTQYTIGNLANTCTVVNTLTSDAATHCNTLQHTATHCNTLQHTTGNLANTCTVVNALNSDCKDSGYKIQWPYVQDTFGALAVRKMRCSVLQCVAVCCDTYMQDASAPSWLKRGVAVCCRALQRRVTYTCKISLAPSCLQKCVAMRCRALPCVAACYRVLQYVAVRCDIHTRNTPQAVSWQEECAAMCCSALQRVAARCSMLQCIIAHMPNTPHAPSY